jgi:UDP-N-acetylmuramoyl-tripeptide--D-alanyl-D-alanine ligase
MPIAFTGEEIYQALGGNCIGCPASLPSKLLLRVNLDSRKVTPGDVYIALKGARFDGNDFVPEAIAKGAAAVITSRVFDSDMPVFVVKDTYAALRSLAVAVRQKLRNTKFIAITGSVGKTTTKDMALLYFAAYGPTQGTRLNYNNHIGVPLSLLALDADTQYAIIEMGMNHAGELSELTSIVRPHVAVITSVHNNHLANFSTVTDIAHAKAEIFTGLEPGGVAVLNRDNEFYDLFAEQAAQCGVRNVVTFGSHEDATVRLLSCEVIGGEYEVEIESPDGDPGSTLATVIRYRMRDIGAHLVKNSLAVIAAGVGLVPSPGCTALGAFRPGAGKGAISNIVLRGERTITIVDESYNCSPVALQANLAHFLRMPAKRHVLILADMVELGPNELQEHLQFSDLIRSCDLALTVGPLFAATSPHNFSSVNELLPTLDAALCDGDLVLIKGSHSWGMDRVVEYIKYPLALT